MRSSLSRLTSGVGLPLLIACATGAAAQEITDQGVARAAARMLTVERECGDLIAMNLDLVRRTGMAFQDVLAQRLGEARAQQSLAQARAELRRDLEAAGRHEWCTGVVRTYRQEGLGQLFEGPR